jgi:ABC-type ATPase involved in cell division
MMEGKSTLIRLLTLIEKPTQGQILINDVDVSQYDSQIVRTKMSVLFQDFRTHPSKHDLTTGKYEELSAFDNIAIGASEPNVPLQPVIESAKLVGIHSKVRTWHSYYDSRLQDDPDSDDPDTDSDNDSDDDSTPSPKTDDPPAPFMAKILRCDMHDNPTVRGRKLKFRWPVPPDNSRQRSEIPAYDRAMDADEEYLYTEWLSGGQWQKVAMARAFMRIREAELLILDEPSSALDPQAEYELFKTLMELRRGKTTIFIVCLLGGLLTGGSHIDFIRFERRIRFWYAPGW